MYLTYKEEVPCPWKHLYGSILPQVEEREDCVAITYTFTDAEQTPILLPHS